MKQTKEEYLYYQTVVGKSHEEDSPRWTEGQIRFISYVNNFLEKGSIILDCACGDGVGLQELKRLGHTAIGMDIAEDKISRARGSQSEVYFADMHEIEEYPNYTFDAIMSSHTLEHAHSPEKVVINFRDKLRKDGKLFIVLPFPDPGDWNKDIHVGKWILRTDGEDQEKVISFFTDLGFTLLDTKLDEYREPEIWISLKKN
jgi:2-polyprenyl-3-methyl-5-hydroxy-6-metoxy-1,4-benzoquinol methylase